MKGRGLVTCVIVEVSDGFEDDHTVDVVLVEVVPDGVVVLELSFLQKKNK